jgi:hypothetical protein
VVRTWLGALALGLLACSGTEHKSEETLGGARSALIPLEPVTTVEPGVPSTRIASCPHHQLPDQCGTWAGVELRASRGKGKSFWHGWHHDEGLEDSHCLCDGIDFQIPATLPVTKGRAGWAWDQAKLSFRKASGDVVECTYRGNGFPLNRGGGDAYVLERCSRGFKADQTAHSDWFELELDNGQPLGDAVEVSLRLGEPDVVGGTVQEQVFYTNDSRIPGAALHVPRGSAPPFETFSLTSLPQVPPGTVLEGGSATSLGYGVDIHSDTTPHFVFTPIAGAPCPRIELPYDQATFERLLGPGREGQLQGNQLLTLTNVNAASGVLASAGPVTVNVAQRTISFCVKHLSFWLATSSTYKASISKALFKGPDGNEVDLKTVGFPPVLTPGEKYTLTLTFKNEGTGAASDWDNMFKLYAVGPATYPSPPASGDEASVTAYGTAGQPAKSPWKESIGTLALDPPEAGVTKIGAGKEGTVAVSITVPNKPAPLNFCLMDKLSNLFGLCFSWEAKATGGGSAAVATVEICDGEDNDLDGDTDEGLKVTAYPDADHDGYGDPNLPVQVCPGTAGYIADGTDCDDTKADRHQAAGWYPDCDGDGFGRNETCDPLAYQESVPITPIPPVTGCVPKPDPVSIVWSGGTVTVNYVTSTDDCNNMDSYSYPGAPEVCNHRDNNCNGTTDDEVVDVSYSIDNDHDGWCQQGNTVLGCPGEGFSLGRIETAYCKKLENPPLYYFYDCNDSNFAASSTCDEYGKSSDTFLLNGGPIGIVDYRFFHVNCGSGWHVTGCDATLTSTRGDIGITYCPVGAVGGDVTIRYGVEWWTDVAGYGTAYCAPNDTYP